MNKPARRFLLVFLLLAGALLALPQAANAQDFLLPEGTTTKKTLTAEEIYESLPADEQERLIAETTKVYNYCAKQGLFSYLHDCRCVSAEFWEERILNYDPNVGPIGVADSVAHKCPNEPGVAGYFYQRCNGYYKSVMSFGLEEFCTCYANTFAKLYMENPRSYIANITRIGSAATFSCSEQGVPSPLPTAPNYAGR